jgi:hypothetical protein
MAEDLGREKLVHGEVADGTEEVGKEELLTCCRKQLWSRSEMESSWKSLIL